MAGKRYWKAGKALSAKIDAMFTDGQAKLDAADVIAKRLGGTGAYWLSGFNERRIAGFAFKKPPDPKLFCRLKNTKDGWRPKRIRANRPLEKELDELRDTLAGQVAKLIGLNCMTSGRDGVRWVAPGVSMSKGVAYIVTHEGLEKANGCTRISDLQYERATAKPDSQRRKDKAKA